MPSIYLRKHSNHRRQPRQRRQAKSQTVLDPQGFEVVRRRRIFATRLTNPTRRAWKHADSQLPRAILVTLWRAQDLMAMDSKMRARKGHVARTRTVADHSRI